MSVTPTGQQASLSSILTGLQSAIMTATGLPVERVRVVAFWPSLPGPVEDQDVLIRPMGFGVLTEQGVHGAGRLDTQVLRQLIIRIRTRLSTDTDQDSIQWFTDQTFGHIQLEESIIDAVHGKFVTDSNGNLLVPSPVLLVESETPTQIELGDGYGTEDLIFDLRYLPPINTKVL